MTDLDHLLLQLHNRSAGIIVLTQFRKQPSHQLLLVLIRPRGLMDKASDFGSEDWGFESLRGRTLTHFFYCVESLSETLFTLGINLRLGWSVHKWTVLSTCGINMHLHMRVEWALVIGYHCPALFADKRVYHFRLQRPDSFVLTGCVQLVW